jgi:hypothetical protein
MPYLVPATGARRQVQALLALGWRLADIEATAGVGVRDLPGGRYQMVRRDRDESIRRAYDRLSSLLGPCRHTASKARTAGYAPPWAWEELFNHVHVLIEEGASPAGVAAAAGVSQTVVRAVAEGAGKSVRFRDAAPVLDVDVAVAVTVTPAALFPAVGSRRRVQALMALGWRHIDIEALAEVTIRDLPGGRQHLVRQERHQAIRRTYDRLSMRIGPCRHTAARARTAGYAPPLAWDEETVDDPDAVPVGVTGPAPSTYHRRAAVLEDVADLVAAGEIHEVIAARIGMRPQALERALSRARHREIALDGCAS